MEQEINKQTIDKAPVGQTTEQAAALLIAVGMLLLFVFIIVLVKNGKRTPQIGLPEVLPLIEGI